MILIASGIDAIPEARDDSRTSLLLSVGLVLAFISGVAMILIATRLGAGLSDDSFAYIQVPREFLAGRGFHPDPAFPPLFPLVLSGIGLLGIDPWVAARWLNALLFGLNAVLLGAVLWRSSRSSLFALIGTGLFLGSEQLINIHSWALSEPLFLTFSLLAFLFALHFIERKTAGFFILIVAAAALASLTRYVGVALFASLSFFLIVWGLREKAWRRWILLFPFLSSLPLILYLARNWLMFQAPFGPRSINYETFSQVRLESALFNFLAWFIPGRLLKEHIILIGLGLLVVVVTALVLLLVIRRPWAKSVRLDLAKNALIWISLLSMAANISVLLISRITSGKGDAFNDRYLAPVFVSLLILLVTVLARLWKTRLPLLMAAVLGLVLVMGAAYSYRSLDTVRTLSADGMGYASARWHISETIAYLNNHPETPVVSTGSTGIYFWTGRLPLSIANFGSLDAMRSYLRDQHAFLVIIDSMPPEMYGINEADLVSGLELLHRFGEGKVYRFPQ